jgi:hypothetical protein
MKAILLSAALSLLSLTGCTAKPTAVPPLNRTAALTGTLPYNPLAWKAITSSFNQQAFTMSTLYGNDAAVQYARTNPDHNYPSGAVLSLVTWSQREDPHWFGARIPGPVKSVEFVTISQSPGQNPTYTYERYEDSPLKKATAADPTATTTRINYILFQRAAVTP